MNSKKITALILCVVFLFLLVIGCNSGSVADPDDSNGNEPNGDTPSEPIAIPDNFTEFFRQLMNEMSEDFGGLMSYPNGYLFQRADMVSEFSDATAALEIGEMSGIVETTYGYHIILRIPINYDVVPSGFSREGRSQTLRQAAAISDFERLQEEWGNSLNVEYTPEYHLIDLEAIFVWLDEDCDDDDDDHNHSHASIDFAAAISAFPPDTVMIRAGDMIVTWAELYVFLLGTTTSIMMYSIGEHFDWSEGFDTYTSVAEAVLDYSTEEVLSFLTFEYGFTSLNIQLDDDERKEIDANIDSLIEMFGGEEEFSNALRNENGFYSLDVFKKFYHIEFLVGKLLYELYGEGANDFPDDKVAEYASENDFMMAMHILRLKSDDTDGDPKSEAEDILRQLHEHR